MFELANHAAIFVSLLSHVSAEFRPALSDRKQSLLGKLRLHLGSREGRAEPSGQVGQHLRRRSRRGHDPVKNVRFVSTDAGLGQRRHIRQRFDPRMGSGDEPAQAARLQLRYDRRIVGEDRGHMAAQQRVDRGSRAGVGHVGHVDVRGALEDLEGDVQRGRGTSARQRQFAGLGARRGQQIGERPVGRGAIDDQHHRGRRQIADRLETGGWIVVLLFQRRIDDEGIRHQQDRIAVRRRARDGLGSDHRAATRAVFDHHRGSLRPSDLLRHQAGQDVGPAAGRVGNDDLDGSRRLRPCALAGGCGQDYGQQRDSQSSATIEFHEAVLRSGIAPDAARSAYANTSARGIAQARCCRRVEKRQLATNTTEAGARSNTAAAVSPKNSLSPGRRPTPMMTRLCPAFFTSARMALSGAVSACTAVFTFTS